MILSAKRIDLWFLPKSLSIFISVFTDVLNNVNILVDGTNDMHGPVHASENTINS